MVLSKALYRGLTWLTVSSQVGCTLTCKFCHTGTQPLVRNLGVHEILQQIMHARDVLGEWPVAAAKKAAAGDDERLEHRLATVVAELNRRHPPTTTPGMV